MSGVVETVFLKQKGLADKHVGEARAATLRAAQVAEDLEKALAPAGVAVLFDPPDEKYLQEMYKGVMTGLPASNYEWLWPKVHVGRLRSAEKRPKRYYDLDEYVTVTFRPSGMCSVHVQGERISSEPHAVSAETAVEYVLIRNMGKLCDAGAVAVERSADRRRLLAAKALNDPDEESPHWDELLDELAARAARRGR